MRLSRYFVYSALLILWMSLVPIFNKGYAGTSCTIIVQPSITYGDKFSVKVVLIAPDNVLNQNSNSFPGTITFTGINSSNHIKKTYDLKMGFTSNTPAATVSFDTNNQDKNLQPSSNSKAEEYQVTGGVTYHLQGTISDITNPKKFFQGSDYTIPCTSSNTLTVNPPPIPNPNLTPLQNNPISQGQSSSSIVAHQFNGENIEISNQTSPPQHVDGDTGFVTVNFTGLTPGDYDVCFKTNQDSCVNGNNYAKSIQNNAQTNKSLDGSLKIEPLCNYGDGNNLQVTKGGTGDPKTVCGNNYFNEGQTYSVGLYSDASPIVIASFYVFHVFPTISFPGPNNGVIISTAQNGDLSITGDTKNGAINNPITVGVSNTIKPGGDNRNDYQLVLHSSIGSKNKCIALNGATFEKSTGIKNPPNNIFTFNDFVSGSSGQGGVPGGNYTLSINEQVNETGITSSKCDGGFTYYSVPISVDGKGNATVDLSQVQKDPAGAETNTDKKDNIPLPPCGGGIKPDATGNCSVVQTGIGDINTHPLDFLGSIMEIILLPLAGLIVLIMLIYGGYQIIFSRGDKEKIAAARERITSAIIGLIFIVLSISLLEIIGVNILQIPGFGK